MSPTTSTHRNTPNRVRSTRRTPQPTSTSPQIPDAHEAAARVGDTVQYHDPRRGHRRIGRVRRILTKGPRRGRLEIVPLYGTPKARCIVRPDALKAIL